jgi:hypothetical protein
MKRAGFAYGWRIVLLLSVGRFTELESVFGGALTTFVSFTKLFVCLFKVSVSGMPGVGVANL